MEQEQNTLLKDYPIQEKGAYFCALATMASADGHASDEELEFLYMMGEAAELPENLRQEVESVAKNPSQVSLQKCLDVLKDSPLRFSLITDIISFAKADGQYTSDEQKHIEEMATYLGVDQKQYSILEDYVQKADDAQQHGEDPTSQSFMSKNGFSDTFKKAGISPQMVQGMLGILAPIVIAKMMGGRRHRRYGGGMMGGLLGGLLGGGMMGGGAYRSRGGMGSMMSILGALNGRRGYSSMGSGGLGSLLGGILGGGKRRGGW
ncbi:TerB family tellurite resistance protein [Pontibacter litorisediminis]|uniref:TerB family tellurite resistance protein n=1 Tax=Pontibacter litorisediminis TaxID=1846260 RepID=UPI0023EC2FC6|nr:TerB family tellurite resistance protein [Pontibacter litorisediminis]